MIKVQSNRVFDIGRAMNLRAIQRKRWSTRESMTLFRISVLAMILWTTTACGPWHKRETDYPGEGVGIIETRTGSGGGVSASSITLVPVGKILVPIPAGEVSTPTPGKFHYQIRSRDGTLHILANDVAFDVGTCVAFSGYADGPSRTHWSFGRTTLIKSEDCAK
jgi:hypothetical protein